MSEKRKGFITGGTWCVDYNITLAAWPDEESASKMLDTQIQGGGSACNFGVDIRKLDPTIPVDTIALIGKDADGEVLRNIATSHQIDDSQLVEDPTASTHRTLAFTALNNGCRTHLFESGASDNLTPDHFDFTKTNAKMLHLGLPGTHALLDQAWENESNGWVAILKKAQIAGLKTNMEIMSISDDEIKNLVLPCLPHLDYLVVNDTEIGALAGIKTVENSIAQADKIKQAMEIVMTKGAMKLIVVHYPLGAFALTQEGKQFYQPSVTVPKDAIVGSNGAGDAFTAGFFCAHHNGGSIHEALKAAHASAAFSLQAVGTYEAMAGLTTCLKQADEWGWRT